jgi:hypothetical protein
VYLDDIAVFGKDFQEHLERLRAIFERMRKANLKFNPDKCRLFQRQIAFLGYVVSSSGVSPDPKKVETILSWPPPSNVTELRAWIGVIGYYRRWIEGFSRRAGPLFELLKKETVFEWTDRQQSAFEDMKTCLISAPILGLPKDNGQFVLDTDASGTAAGAILSQHQDGEIRVLAYASRTFHGAELRYSTNQRELAAVIFGLKTFHPYLLGRSFVLRTYHSSLKYLMKTKDVMTIQGRYLDFFSPV